ncbi:MAG: carbon-nitrogen family hydrolase [Tepidanaerobacteraceae bacterium]|jgi:predicted amidohydrolase|nr:carbon-nitrogen family hydrolase [Tepidanaerobacteraceae bacterium]
MPEEIKLKVSLIQMDVAFGDPEQNRRRAEAMIKEALKQRKKPDVLVLPEMWTTGYDLARISDIADREGSPTIDWLQEVAGKNRVNIVAGSIADRRAMNLDAAGSKAARTPDGTGGCRKVYSFQAAGAGEKESNVGGPQSGAAGTRSSPNKKEGVFNSSYVINRDGEIVARYDKVHRFRLMEEDRYLSPGKEAVTFELDGIPCGIIICYDLRFPEFVRKLALLGAKVLFIPAQWPRPREIHWKLLNIVRAIENQFFVVAVNRAGKDGKEEFPGMSLVVDPWGEVLLEGSDRQEVLTATLDLSRIDHARRKITVFEDRRPELY